MIFTSPTRKSALKQQGASECPSVNNKKKNHCYNRKGRVKRRENYREEYINNEKCKNDILYICAS
jgi:hypothetical protein